MPNSLSKQLVARLSEIGPCVIAFSGGVDSSVVAAAAYRALGGQCVAVTGVGPAVSEFDRNCAVQAAAQIGIRHEFVVTQEQQDPNYIANNSRRCYYCKSELYRRLQAYADLHRIASLVSGTNADDLGDYRPGLQAGTEHRVHTPLADLKITKSDVRSLASEWNLVTANRPAAPCLASRIAYGIAADAKALQMVELSEAYLRTLGFDEVRVRLHADQLARIEIAKDDLDRFFETVDMDALRVELMRYGFRFVTMDLAGLKSGSLNTVIVGKTLPILQ